MRITDREADQDEGLNMTPLIDMVFLLLIFFLVATTFTQEERDLSVRLPNTSAVAPISAAPQQLIINIKRDGAVIVAGRAYGDQELRELVSRVAREEPDRGVLIRAYDYTYHKFPAGVLSLCRNAGISEAKIGYLPSATSAAGAP